jgi:hypothetical protein
VPAQSEDTTLSNAEVGRRLGKGHAWVRDLVRWRTSERCSTTNPFAENGSATRVRWVWDVG